MIVYIYAFILAFIISFVGSVQPGPVNLAVISSSFQKQYRNAIFIAIGGSLPEFVFCLIALKTSTAITKWQHLFFYYQISISILLLIIGLYLWFNKSKIILKTTKRNGFFLGAILASLNPQLIIFWTTVVTYLHVNNTFNLNLEPTKSFFLFFCVGASIGAFCLHSILIFTSKIFVNMPLKLFFNYADKTIAIILLILAIMQIIKLLN